MVLKTLPAGMIGLLIAGMFAATISSADSGLNAALPPALLPGASPDSAGQQSARGLHSPAGAGLAGRRPNLICVTPQQAAGNVAAFNRNAGIFVRIFYRPILRPEASEKEQLLALLPNSSFGRLSFVGFGLALIGLGGLLYYSYNRGPRSAR